MSDASRETPVDPSYSDDIVAFQVEDWKIKLIGKKLGETTDATVRLKPAIPGAATNPHRHSQSQTCRKTRVSSSGIRDTLWHTGGTGKD
jgi:hypothetical protein